MSERELATVLAALRYWQRVALAEPATELPEDDIADATGTVRPLNAEEIDGLCLRLNDRGRGSLLGLPIEEIYIDDDGTTDEDDAKATRWGLKRISGEEMPYNDPDTR